MHFLSSFVTDDKGEHGLNLENVGSAFFKLYM